MTTQLHTRIGIRGGFSLPELLVVIGIVAVLLSLLFPAITSARASADRVHCMSNLRQLLQAEMAYVADSAGHLTYPNWGHDRVAANVWQVGWLYAQGRVSSPPQTADVQSGALYRYVNDARVYRCPLHAVEDASAAGTDRLTSYIMNGAVCGYGSVGLRDANPPVPWVPSWKITDWRNTAEQVLFWEADEQGAGTSPNGSAAWNDGGSYPHENLLARRHGRGACAGFFDGHVAWMDRLDYLAELQLPGPNRLYCDPHSATGGKP